MDAILKFCRKTGVDGENGPAAWSLADLQALVLELMKREVARDHAHSEATPAAIESSLQRWKGTLPGEMASTDGAYRAGARSVGHGATPSAKGELYVPKAGERVRVVEVNPIDPSAMHKVGDEVTTCDAQESVTALGWLTLTDEYGSTWCRVEPVTPWVEPMPCPCLRCSPQPEFGATMRCCVCCGNKRCPHNEWHGFRCTNSNELDQVGVLLDAPQVEPGQAERTTLPQALVRISNQQFQNDNLRENVRQLRSEVERLTKERDELGGALDKANRAILAAADKLSASQAEVERLEANLHRVRVDCATEFERMDLKLSASQERVKALDTERFALVGGLERIHKSLGKRDNHEPKMLEACIIDGIASAAHELGNVRSENARLAKELAEHVAANQELMRVNAGLRGPAPDAPRPIVLGSTWRYERAEVRIDAWRKVESANAVLVQTDTGAEWPVDEFRQTHTWLSDPPPQPIPAGEGGAK